MCQTNGGKPHVGTGSACTHKSTNKGLNQEPSCCQVTALTNAHHCIETKRQPQNKNEPTQHATVITFSEMCFWHQNKKGYFS